MASILSELGDNDEWKVPFSWTTDFTQMHRKFTSIDKEFFFFFCTRLPFGLLQHFGLSAFAFNGSDRLEIDVFIEIIYWIYVSAPIGIDYGCCRIQSTSNCTIHKHTSDASAFFVIFLMWPKATVQHTIQISFIGKLIKTTNDCKKIMINNWVDLHRLHSSAILLYRFWWGSFTKKASIYLRRTFHYLFFFFFFFLVFDFQCRWQCVEKRHDWNDKGEENEIKIINQLAFISFRHVSNV